MTRCTASGLAATQIFFLIGADAFAEIATWSRYPAVLDLAHFVVVARPGVTLAVVCRPRAGRSRRAWSTAAALRDRATPGIALLHAQTPDVSSTDIRAARADGRSLAGLVLGAGRAVHSTAWAVSDRVPRW